MQQERRGGHRACLPGAYVVYESARHAPREADLHDIGMGGLFIPAATPLPRGTRLAMEIRLSRGSPSWAALGRVVWTRASASAGRPSGMGVRLVDLDEAAVEAIERAIGPAAPAREKTVRGVGTPTPSAVWVANGRAVERATRRGRRRATAAALLVAAAAALALGVRETRVLRMQERAAAVAAPVVTAPVEAPPPAPSETAPASSAPPATASAASSQVVPHAPASTSKPASRATTRPVWTAPPKRSGPATSDNPY